MGRRAILALGANLGDRAATFERALALVAARIGPVVARSAWRETAPMVLPDEDPARHPRYLNGVAIVRTDEAPAAILEELHAIERALGRDRAREQKRWQPRVLDLDLLAVEDEVVDGPGLVLPHPRLHERDFVLGPLVELWPDWRHPRLGRTARELLADLG